MGGRIRIRKYEAVLGCGSFEVRLPDGRPTKFFHFDDLASRRLRPETLRANRRWSRPRRMARAERDNR